MRVLLAGCLLAAATVAAPPASASHGYNYSGGCGFATVNDPTPDEVLGGKDTWTGEIDILARALDGTPSALPSTASITVRCDLYVNGVLSRYGALSASGAGVAAAAATLQFTAGEDQVITICEAVTVGTWSNYNCGEMDPPQLIPPIVFELVDRANDTVGPVFAEVDARLCPELAKNAGTYGPVTIDDGGDVYLFGTTYWDLWWDCPPYEQPW